MGDLSVSIATELVMSMLEYLKDVIVEQAQLIGGAKNQVEMLEENIRFLKDFLVDSTKFPEKDNVVIRNLLRNIRDSVYEAEDVVDTFISSVQGKNSFLRAFTTPMKVRIMANNVHSVGHKVRDLSDEVKDHIKSTRHNAAQDGGLEEYDYEAPLTREDKERMVGFEDEERKLIGLLTRENEHLDVICITGMPGVGKTKLAANIFHHPTIQQEFSKRIWVSVSNATTRKVLHRILRKLDKMTKDMQSKCNEDLARLVAGHLEHERFLVVMDDVWTASDWRKLRICFPKGHKMGKVLITSCYEGVAPDTTNPHRPHIKLHTLSPEEGWRLLQLRVFGDSECPPELQIPGKLIVQQCGGLPMAIVDIAVILENKVSEDAWKRVNGSKTACSNDDPTMLGRTKLLSSYNKLPYHLRACFLYLGMFPKDHDIQVSTLIQMWIAEGFVQQNNEPSLEVAAGKCLDDLISRSLVSVGKRKPNGSAKTCRIPYFIRYFCKSQAEREEENFLQELNLDTYGDFRPSIDKSRRLCIYSNVVDFLSLKTSGRRVRTFACFSKIQITLKEKNASTIPKAFKLLRVLDVKPITFTKIPDDFYLLVHLRYITLSLDLPILPSHFSKLRSLQTLIVDITPHTSKTLEIKADILKMIQLRHFKTNVSATLRKTSKRSKGGKKLQTLGTISPKSCTPEFFDRVCNLNKLSVHGELALLLDGKDESFHFAKLRNLHKLKLINVHSESQNHRLPANITRFPDNLRSLTLSGTSLEWSDMNILGSLYKLEVLKLRNNAFVGDTWVTKDGGFCCLQFLHIGSKDLVVWQASSQHFPKLRCLELWNCEKLGEVPIQFAQIQTFERLELWKSSSAAESANKILMEKRRKENEQTTSTGVFKLSVSE